MTGIVPADLVHGDWFTARSRTSKNVWVVWEFLGWSLEREGAKCRCIHPGLSETLEKGKCCWLTLPPHGRDIIILHENPKGVALHPDVVAHLKALGK